MWHWLGVDRGTLGALSLAPTQAWALGSSGAGVWPQTHVWSAALAGAGRALPVALPCHSPGGPSLSDDCWDTGRCFHSALQILQAGSTLKDVWGLYWGQTPAKFLGAGCLGHPAKQESRDDLKWEGQSDGESCTRALVALLGKAVAARKAPSPGYLNGVHKAALCGK